MTGVKYMIFLDKLSMISTFLSTSSSEVLFRCASLSFRLKFIDLLTNLKECDDTASIRSYYIQNNPYNFTTKYAAEEDQIDRICNSIRENNVQKLREIY